MPRAIEQPRVDAIDGAARPPLQPDLFGAREHERRDGISGTAANGERIFDEARVRGCGLGRRIGIVLGAVDAHRQPVQRRPYGSWDRVGRCRRR